MGQKFIVIPHLMWNLFFGSGFPLEFAPYNSALSAAERHTLWE